MKLDQIQAPQVTLHIGHEQLNEGSGGKFDHFNSVSGEMQASIPLAGETEINSAVAKAVAAFPDWLSITPETRRDLLLKLAQLIHDNGEEFARMAALDGGIPLTWGREGVKWGCSWINYYAGWCDKLDGQLHGTFASRQELSYSAPEPCGVVGIINTWNGPLISLGMKVGAALAAGNCVIVKSSELVPFASNLFAELVKQAGFPDGVFSMLTGSIQAGEVLVSHPDVEMISFTGGPQTARKILASCSEQMKPSVMELGGKSANLIFPDADLDAACERATFNIFGINSGQGCSLPTRLLVHADIYDEVLEKIANITKTFRWATPSIPRLSSVR